MKYLFFMLKAVVSSALLIFLVNMIDWETVRSLGQEAAIGIFIVVVINLLALIFLAFRWQIILNLQKVKALPVKEAYNGYIMGMFFNIFMLGTIGGDIARIKYGADQVGTTIKESTLVVVVERLLGLAALLLIFGVGVFYNANLLLEIEMQTKEFVILSLVLVGLLITVRIIAAKYVKLNLSTFFWVLVLSIIPHLANVLIVFVLVWAIGLSIGFVKLLFVVPLVQIVTLLPISLGGLGVREGMLVGMLALFGVVASDGVIISLMMFLSLIIVGLLGAPLVFKKLL